MRGARKNAAWVLAAAGVLGVAAESRAACPAVPSWASGRNAACELVVNSGNALGAVTFDSEMSYAKKVTGGLYDCGSDSARCNHAYFEYELDGYNGTAVTGNSCTGPNQCGQGPKGNSSDLGRIWANVRAESILMKGLYFHNGWKACGDCTSNAQQPHVDNLQVWGQNNQIVRNLIIQDTIFRNSDDQLFHMTQTGGGLKVLVLQNVLLDQQSLFIQECSKRAAGAGGLQDSGCGGNPNTLPSNANDHSNNWDTWLIGVRTTGGVQMRMAQAGSEATNKVIFVDTPTSAIDLRYNTGVKKTYASIEAAIAAGEKKPPFVELSCAGWATKPAKCVSTQGPKGDGGGPTTPPPTTPTPLPAPVQLN